MATEYMTVEELKKLAQKKHIYIPSGYKKMDMIDYINEELEKMKIVKKKVKYNKKTKENSFESESIKCL